MNFIRNLFKFTGFLLLLILLLLAGLIRPDLSVERLAETYATEDSHFFAVDGMIAHYRDEGPADAPVLLLLHGTFASLHTWDAWTAALTPDFRVIRVDLPGFGLTGPQPDNDYGIRATLSFLEALRRETGTESWSVAGNSLGARYAMAWAQHFPQQTESLILLNGGGIPVQTVPPEQQQQEQQEQALVEHEPEQAHDVVADTARASATPDTSRASAQQQQRSSLLLDALGNPVVRKGLSILTPKFAFRHSLREVYYDRERISEETVTQYYELLRREGNRQAFLTRNQGPLPGADRSHLPELPEPSSLDDTPVLILWGEHDNWIPVQNAHRIAAAIPHASLIIYEDAGHVPMEEIPDRSVADTARFLKGQE
ncbi:Pimeloyl-ACP methyl ester carboxylesterase [Cyclonatronum proteinivorum]|uniref:Pimeloyl-ACP methyl ester carboxylesterase n=1 Tax=Cyclonatronum proteinivorum TaxID=1457365 RepID=A0A345UM13_9BACT|nr:alpha/beta hydrolase [Cyclonatronum proteinivorum]AXJ01515.1 Pimeloyl-ACP methyl ester carboxylesterase [Cyclonatronum proteinivorum]